MTDKQMINCPVCKMKFIPRTFYPDEAIFSNHDGKKLSGFNGYISSRTVKPPEVIVSSWVTYCPSCNYILRFVKEIVRKEKIHTQNSSPSDVTEKYNSYYYGFPYGDYSQHLREVITKVKDKIENEFQDLNFSIWEDLYSIDDNFKFLVRFFASLENYCNSKLGMVNDKNMANKIKNLNLPKEIEIPMLQLNNIKDGIVKGDYELSSDDEDNINNILVAFVLHLIKKHIQPLIDKKQLEKGYKFIKFEDFELQIKSYLGNYLYTNFNNDPNSNRQIRLFLSDLYKEIGA
ncbi:MAG TPA: hypothetical protein VMV43_10360 [Candidatus Nanopelagicaceae bacterium]|nr:hypothetical protein [Candidatus Nanopelagicaceae bacterium]